MDPRARAVRDCVLMPEQPGAQIQQAALFGHPSTHALAAVVSTVQRHAESLEDTQVENAVALVSAIASKADGSSECTDCFPEACACAENGLARLVSQLAALEGAALSISQRGQRGALEKLLCQAISSAATDPPLARATIGALRRAAGEESREGVETLGPLTHPAHPQLAQSKVTTPSHTQHKLQSPDPPLRARQCPGCCAAACQVSWACCAPPRRCSAPSTGLCGEQGRYCMAGQPKHICQLAGAGPRLKAALSLI